MQDLRDLQNVNLNLLIPLKALLEHRNVSRAAESMNLTQSTMSRYLAQLRDFFDDPLLVRLGTGYVLTPKGKLIGQNIDAVLADISGLFSNEFNPATHRRDFHITAPDYVMRHVFNEVLAPFLGRDNMFTFHLHDWGATARDKLLTGDMHLAISLDDVFPQNIHRRIIDEDKMVCVSRREHPSLGEIDELDVDLIPELDFVIVSTGGGRCKGIDVWLEERGMQRRIKMTVPGYMSAFGIIANTDLVAVVPNHVARDGMGDLDLLVLPVPSELPLLRYSLWWHERFHKDASHRWLRENLFPRLLACPSQLGLSRPD